MAQCPRCKRVWNTPKGEEQDHDCPRCTPTILDDELSLQSDEEAEDDEYLDNGPDVGEAEAERADECRDARRHVEHGD
jgi:hypothetical protein